MFECLQKLLAVNCKYIQTNIQPTFEDVVKPARIPSIECCAVGPKVVEVPSHHTSRQLIAGALIAGGSFHLVGVFAVVVFGSYTLLSAGL